MIGEILNGSVVILLVVTIVYAIRLNGKLNLIKNQKQEFATNIKAFNDAAETAIVAVEELHIKGEAVCKLIDEKIKRAGIAGDEMEFMLSCVNKKIASVKLPQVAEHIRERPVNSFAEGQLIKALREREFKEALNVAKQVNA